MTPSSPGPRRRSTLALAVIGALLLGWLALALHAAWAQGTAHEARAQSRALVQALALTDAAWFTEARYTRHPGLADLHSAFQDAPGGAEHFPSGAWVAPPRHFPAAGLQLMPPEPAATPRTDE